MLSAEDPRQESLGDRLLRVNEVAQILGLNVDTLKRWRRRSQQTGPDFIKVGRCVRYSAQALQRYLSARTVRVANGKTFSTPAIRQLTPVHERN